MNYKTCQPQTLSDLLMGSVKWYSFKIWEWPGDEASFSVQRELKSCTGLCSVCMSLISSQVWTRLEILVSSLIKDISVL